MGENQGWFNNSSRGGRNGGRKFALTKAQVRLAQSAMVKKKTRAGEVCAELKVTRPTQYRYVSPDGTLRQYGSRVLQL